MMIEGKENKSLFSTKFDECLENLFDCLNANLMLNERREYLIKSYQKTRMHILKSTHLVIFNASTEYYW